MVNSNTFDFSYSHTNKQHSHTADKNSHTANCKQWIQLINKQKMTTISIQLTRVIDMVSNNSTAVNRQSSPIDDWPICHQISHTHTRSGPSPPVSPLPQVVSLKEVT